MAIPVMRITEFSTAVGRSVTTIRRWEQSGLLIPTRDPVSGDRLFGPEHVQQALRITARSDNRGPRRAPR
jgi:DNA-binding transcriptional MerR regulator